MVLLRAHDRVETLALRLSGLGLLASSWLDATCIVPYLGGVAVLLGEYEKALELY